MRFPFFPHSQQQVTLCFVTAAKKPVVLLIEVVLLCKVTGTEYKYADKLTLLEEGGEGKNGVRIYFI